MQNQHQMTGNNDNFMNRRRITSTVLSSEQLSEVQTVQLVQGYPETNSVVD